METEGSGMGDGIRRVRRAISRPGLKMLRRLPAPVERRLRRFVEVSPRILLRYRLDGTVLVISGTYEASAGAVRGLELWAVGRSVGLTVPNTAKGSGFAFRIDLDEARRELAVAVDVVDLTLLVAGEGGREVRERLGLFDRTERPQEAVATVVDGVDVVVENTARGFLALHFGDRLAAPPAHRTRALTRTDSGVRVELELSTRNTQVLEAQLVATGRQSGVSVAAPLALVPDPRAGLLQGGHLVYAASGELETSALATAMPDTEETVDVHLVTNPGTALERKVRVHVPAGRHGRRMRSATAEVGERTTLFVPYSTFRAHNLSYRLERYRPEDYRYMRRLSRVGWVFVLTRPFTRIWLIGEVPYKAQDNGYQLFRYLRTTHPARRAYYVIDAASPDRAKLAPYGNVVDLRSRQHIRYTMAASRLIGSHHAEYLLASRDRRVTRWARGVRVFLQHGPTANKNVTLNYGRQGTSERPTERFIVTSELEKRIVVEDYGYRPHQVSVAGFARFDALFEDDVEHERTVLVMPTWRDSLMDEEIFLASDYYANWHGFVHDHALHEALAASGLEVKLLLHPNMRKYADHFESDRVSVIRQDDVDVQRLLKACAVLITDFSSVCWDFSYLHKPVLFFQFDRSMLVKRRAPHIDFDTMLPGPVSTTPATLLADLQAVIGRGLVMTPEHQARADAFLTYRDRHNCERIEGVVAHAWNARVAFERVRNHELAQLGWRWFRRRPAYFRAMRVLNRVARLLPRTDVVLFECDRGVHYGDAPRYLYERLAAREHGLRMVWADNTTTRFTDPRTRKIRRHSPTYWWVASRARYWVNNQNFPTELRPGRKTEFLMTWHGTPLKRMQHDVEQMAGRDDDYHKRAARLTSYWTILLSASAYATRAFRSAFQFTGRVLEVGYPRNDVFSWPGTAERAARVRARLGLADDHRQVILYAPTFRDDERSGVHWKQRLEIDIAGLEAALSDRYVLVVRFHQLVRDALPAQFRSSTFVVDASDYPDVQELMLASDVLVTDYSSLFFDYAALGRPMVFFAYDLPKYRNELRGFYLDYETEVPGPIARTNAELVATLDDLEARWSAYGQRLADFRQTYGPLDDGGASDRVLDAFFGDVIGPARSSLAVPVAAAL
ncbi:CDP-glycerol glycerophosphotransferase family protein [Cellulomonas edaphi]|uniref:CDP-glycerol glycerophosphotransferase family protein n=1 Tax=Cellulomonas edaphi TaxID=3053468 RepID=A0ABT7S811_9CELL|nr:CDP-glycerol glycerophosphotransferase family protein [Cellulomons edaphi]MDM7831768.1 CDP-glycerol glycerophosphotransferase family protein [Cellulomons edaphi]